MYSSLRLAGKYFHYLITSSNGNGHGIHSPFVFHFIKSVLNDTTAYDDYKPIEDKRRQLIDDARSLSITDLGAGSRSGSTSRRSVSDIAKSSLKPKKYAQLLYRVCRTYRPSTVIELGTSLGITTAYLCKGNPNAQVYTIEGADAVAELAKENLGDLGCDKVRLVNGSFENNLPAVIEKAGTVDLAFIDGNHREEPTLRYFEQLLSKRNNNSIFIFDDIHWSSEMENAWAKIKAHSSVRCTIDLFFIGLVFFRNEFKQSQHFRIRF